MIEMVTGQFCVWTGPRRRRRASGWLLTLNIICSVMFPVETFATAPTMNHDYSTYQQNQSKFIGLIIQKIIYTNVSPEFYFLFFMINLVAKISKSSELKIIY